MSSADFLMSTSLRRQVLAASFACCVSVSSCSVNPKTLVPKAPNPIPLKP